MKSTTIISILSAVASQTLAREIVLGSRSLDRPVAWIVGDNPCDNAASLAFTSGANPCGERFTLDGFQRLHFENCGRADAPL
jgi:hypothetical protein